MAGSLGDYQVQGMYAAAALRHIARQSKTDAMLGTRWDRALTEEERTRLRKVSKLVNEARQLLEA